MNAERRKLIAEATALLSRAKDMLEQARDDEQEAYDNLPDSFRDGDRGETMNEHIDNLTTVVDAIEEFTGHDF
jgi:hypothetical protein